VTEIIGRPAANPVGDLTCAFGLGFAAPQSGFLEELALAIIPPVREVRGGVEVAFTVESEEAVRRYMETESGRRSDLAFSVRRTTDAIVLSVTGRPEG